MLAVMGAYNKFRGQYCCQNDYLLNRVLKDEWGFQGLVMSDWGGTHDTREAVLNGLDLEMGTNRRITTIITLRSHFSTVCKRAIFRWRRSTTKCGAICV